MSKRGNTKQRILEEAMKLFSIQGFDAVSIRTIADAVGVGNSALYKHFSSKQEILEAIVAYSMDYFIEQENVQMKAIQSKEDLVNSCLEMFHFQTKDSWMVMFRRVLMLEQFKNPDMARISRECFMELPVATLEKVFDSLMKEGYMKKRTPKVVAVELYAPFFLYHTAPDIENLEETLIEHVENFWEENFVCR